MKRNRTRRTQRSTGFLSVATLLALEEERTLERALAEVEEELYIEYLLHEDHEQQLVRDDEADFSI